ncbi:MULTISPECIES: efflux RND transporter periplasmic adaptor subunit [Zobellia]|uniref:Macrolide-specific membrane fusion protein n=1 Tax=Zobellia galactanivorans (strain DSM 12802 / CCUG 47099 / CIP 106680 / NCIMB 13871 / Dsij) TaxID=63186 RepID=G0KZJ2_ZOBGA|nr:MULTISPECIES: efflux RND transporter periplasmic adaptor subunit [Zobellia]MBU3024903.1 efflux RND transporter periplasmic adaptor subunit [Zobellia galactanivorans]OWW25769.1 efflux transporter periplasmic adaptor subunit [Zobellia sp. OII3]CAZ98410.1 Macrolide-specific membrane fusion protein [Zobellia galactanivorans]
MKNKRKIIIGGLALVLIAFVAYSFLNGGDSVTIEAKTVAAQKGNVTTMVTATGTIEPITQVEVGTQVSGVVEKIYVDYNSVVTEGQLIAELDKTNLKAATVQAQAAYDNAVSQRNYTKTIYERQKTLFENQVISQSDFDDAVYNYETAKGNVTQRLSDLQKAKTNLEYANIYSPIDGVVLSRDIDEGQTVAASYSTPTLFTIAQDLREMQVEADVDEADIGQVQEGQRVSFTVDAYQGEIFSGIVTQVRLNPTVTSNVVTYTVVIKADNPDLKLKPGLTATISIYTLELKDVLSVEAKAINFKPSPPELMAYNKQQNLSMARPEHPMESDEEATVVWIYGANGAISPQKVTLGASDGVKVQILSGIKEGDQLVYSLKSESTIATSEPSGSSESPFMPKPPGSKKK